MFDIVVSIYKENEEFHRREFTLDKCIYGKATHSLLHKAVNKADNLKYIDDWKKSIKGHELLTISTVKDGYDIRIIQRPRDDRRPLWDSHGGLDQGRNL